LSDLTGKNTFQPDEVQIHLLRMDEEGKVFEPFLTLLPHEEQARYSGFASPSRRGEFLAARLLARFLLSFYIEKEPHDLKFYVHEGKPFVAGSPFRFNLSHTAGLIACSLSLREVGIDVERMETGSKTERPWALLAKRFFSPEEQDYLFSFLEASRHQIFYQIFTMKEAYAKALGQGLSLSWTNFSVPLPLAEKSFLGNFELFTKTDGDICLAHAAENASGDFYRYGLFEWDEKTLTEAFEKKETEQPTWKTKRPMTPLSLVRV
jgi:4'-phosphopantetheinyl transferase